jgi:hypothetical protein
MRKALFAGLAGLLLLAALPVFAQTASGNPKDAYNKVVPLTKVWMHPLGYLLQFFNSKSQIAEIYVPLTWFNKGVESKADIVYGAQPSYPYASIFWVDGKFDHIIIYAWRSYDVPSWGVLENVTDRTAKFNVEEVPKDF